MDRFALATLPAAADEAGEPPPQVLRATGQPHLVRNVGVDEGIAQITYRPFDTRFIWYDRRAIERGDARWPVMKHVLPHELALLTSRQSVSAHFSSVLVTRGLSEMKTAESTRGSSVFPLFLKDDDTLLAGAPGGSNLQLDLLGADLAARTPLELLHFVYAILHSPTYRTRYAGALKIEFPRIPTECPAPLADVLCRLGSELVAMHLMESPKLDTLISTYAGPKSPRVERVGWSDDTVWLDAAAAKKGQFAKPGTVGFHSVPEAIWNFRVGGYQVCHKWLKDRKGRTLSTEDTAHYERIVIALSETIRLMEAIDAVIDNYGGWPDAFADGS